MASTPSIAFASDPRSNPAIIRARSTAPAPMFRSAAHRAALASYRPWIAMRDASAARARPLSSLMNRAAMSPWFASTANGLNPLSSRVVVLRLRSAEDTRFSRVP